MREARIQSLDDHHSSAKFFDSRPGFPEAVEAEEATVESAAAEILREQALNAGGAIRIRSTLLLEH